MKRLEHVNLVVSDINATLAFLQAAFPEWSIRGQGTSEWFGTQRQWLHFGTHENFITLNQGNQDPNRDLTGHAPGLAHIGFQVDDLDSVRRRLQQAGYEPAILGADHPYRRNLYYHEPCGFEFEFVQYLSELPEQKNMYGGETSDITRINN